MKRFYKDVTAVEGDGGFQIHLDDKPVNTPARALFLVPNQTLAKAVVKEWQDQGDKVDPASMPLNRLANTAIDRTKLRFDEVVREALNFSLHDLICHRASEPDDLVKQETKAWDPYLNWVENAWAVTLKTTVGIATIEQDPNALKTFKEILQGHDPFTLTGVHNATTLSGSLVMGLALQKGFRDPEQIWDDAHVDDDYQISRWGQDDEAAKLQQGKKEMWLAVGRFLEHIKSQ